MTGSLKIRFFFRSPLPLLPVLRIFLPHKIQPGSFLAAPLKAASLLLSFCSSYF